MNFRQICKNIQRKVDRIVFLLDTATGTRYFETCFLLAVIFLYFIAYPYPWILALDDYIVLGERAWFDSSHEWLSHLLFFNQTRFTTSGDFHLFRPGLFIFYFITQDVLLPLGMKVVSAWICLINILGFFCVYRFLSVLCNKLVAVPLALWILFPAPIGHMLYVWPHIQPYWLAIAFFSIGGTLAIRATRVASPETDRAYILAGVSLFAGSMFHEFVIIATLSCIIILLSYGILIKEERLVGPSNKSFSDRTRSLLLMFSIPVLSYSVIRLLVFILFDESEYRRTEAITTSLASISVFVKTILAQATTFQSLAVGGTVFGMALIVVVKKILTGGMARRLEAVIVLSAFAAIVLILVYGRVLPGGGDVMPWYNPILSFVGVGIVALFCQFLWLRWSAWRPWLFAYVLATYGVGAVLHVPELRAKSYDYAREYGSSITAAFAVRRDLDSEPTQHCLAGIRGNTDKIDSEININIDSLAGRPFGFDRESRHRMLAFLLHDKICDDSPGIPVTYEFKSDFAEPVRAEATFVQNNLTYIDLSKPTLTLTGARIPKIIVSMTTGNIFEARGASKEITPDELIVYQYVSGIFGAHLLLDAKNDEFPQMYNTAIVFGLGEDDVQVLTIALHDADIVVSKGIGEHAHVVSTGHVPRISKFIKLKIYARDGVCDLYVNNYMATQISFCTLPKGYIGLYHFGNGTLSETASRLAVLTH